MPAMSTFKIRPTSYQLPDEDSLIRKSDANSNRLRFVLHFPVTINYSCLSSHLAQSKASSECSSSNPGNPFGDFEQASTTIPGNPFGEIDSDEDEPDEDGERQVQIKFMRKEIKKLTARGDMAKADMVRQVLDEMLNAWFDTARQSQAWGA